MSGVSVVIPAYNGGDRLELAVRSALEQTLPPLEVVVVDDGSTDGTWDLLQRLGPDVRSVRQRNAGTAAARNTGVAAARGEFIALLDQDDVWDPEKLAHQLPLFADPAVGMVHGGARFAVDDRVTSTEVAVPGLDVHALLTWCWVLQSTTVLRASVLAEVGPFDVSLSAADDWDMWIRVSSASRLACDDRVDVTVRIHEANQSHDAERMYAAAEALFAKHASIHPPGCRACHDAETYRGRRNRQEYYRRRRAESAVLASEHRYAAALRATAAGVRRHPRALLETASHHARNVLDRR